MYNENPQSVGSVRCERELGRNLVLGRLEYPGNENRWCVIHFLPPGDDLARRRFVNEAMIGLDISRDHQNLISTLHFGEWNDGRLFQVQDCVEGRAVSELYEQLIGQYETIWGIGQAMLGALLHIHGRGVVHGLVSAENILVGYDGIIRLGSSWRARRVDDWSACRVDYRALARLLHELMTGRRFRDFGDGQLHFPLDAPEHLRELVERLMSDDLLEHELSSLDRTRVPSSVFARADEALALERRRAANTDPDAVTDPVADPLAAEEFEVTEEEMQAFSATLVGAFDSVIQEAVAKRSRAERNRLDRWWIPGLLGVAVLLLMFAVHSWWQRAESVRSVTPPVSSWETPPVESRSAARQSIPSTAASEPETRLSWNEASRAIDEANARHDGRRASSRNREERAGRVANRHRRSTTVASTDRLDQEFEDVVYAQDGLTVGLLEVSPFGDFVQLHLKVDNGTQINLHHLQLVVYREHDGFRLSPEPVLEERHVDHCKAVLPAGASCHLTSAFAIPDSVSGEYLILTVRDRTGERATLSRLKMP